PSAAATKGAGPAGAAAAEEPPAAACARAAASGIAAGSGAAPGAGRADSWRVMADIAAASAWPAGSDAPVPAPVSAPDRPDAAAALRGREAAGDGVGRPPGCGPASAPRRPVMAVAAWAG